MSHVTQVGLRIVFLHLNHQLFVSFTLTILLAGLLHIWELGKFLSFYRLWYWLLLDTHVFFHGRFLTKGHGGGVFFLGAVWSFYWRFFSWWSYLLLDWFSNFGSETGVAAVVWQRGWLRILGLEKDFLRISGLCVHPATQFSVFLLKYLNFGLHLEFAVFVLLGFSINFRPKCLHLGLQTTLKLIYLWLLVNKLLFGLIKFQLPLRICLLHWYILLLNRS